jgi:transglutaminase-like putative cysteine protease
MPATLSNPRSWQLPAAAVFATMACSVGLSRLIHPGLWLAMVLLVAVLLAVSGIVLRRLNVPRALIVLIQAVIVLCTLTVMLVPGVAIGGLVPGPGALRELSSKFSAGGDDLRGFSPPTPVTPGITALMAVSGAGFSFLIEVLSVTLRRPVLAGAPILAVYLIPATRQPGGLSWLAFVCAATGYLALVGTDGHERLGQWGRTVHHRTGRPSLSGATNTGLTRRISVWAIGAALLLPLLIPATPQLLNLGGNGSGGGGGGNGTIYLKSTVDIASDLTNPKSSPLFSYRTSSTSPLREYFPQEVLTQFNGNEWDPPTSVVEEAPGAATVPGLTNAGVAKQNVHVSVSVNGDFGFSTAPSPFATTNVSGLPDVKIDANTMTVLVKDKDYSSRQGARYTTTSTQLTPTAAQLIAATAGQDAFGKSYLTLPSNVRDLLTRTAERITAGDATPYQKALALQYYFQTDFTYTLTPKITGTGTAAIESFLQNKSGFCQQFAATMAAMARALGIPAVVDIGYTPGTEQSDGSFQVTTHDAHAWPMLYFDGIGWVQFEPTPKIVSGGRAQAQPWTVPLSQPTTSSSAGAGQVPTTAASPQATGTNCANNPGVHHVGVGGPAANGDCNGENSGAGATSGQKFGSLGPFGVVPRTFERWFLTGNAAQIAVKLLLLLLVLLAMVPAVAGVWRRRKRRRLLRRAAADRPKQGQKTSLPSARSAVDGPDVTPLGSHLEASSAARRELAFAAWAELREYATDLGYGWAPSDTPRQLAGRLAAQAEFDEESTEAVGRVTTLVERAVYSPDPHIAADEARSLPGDVHRVRGALAGAASRAARLRAAVLPSSSFEQLLRRGKRQR